MLTSAGKGGGYLKAGGRAGTMVEDFAPGIEIEQIQDPARSLHGSESIHASGQNIQANRSLAPVADDGTGVDTVRFAHRARQ
jgi:hypothetical protein